MSFTICKSLLICLLLAAMNVSASSSAPNIVFIVVDDLRPESGTYGNPIAHTPNMDRLAATSIQFKRAYNQWPQCMWSSHPNWAA